MGLVLDRFDGPAHLKLTLLILADHSDSDGICWPSYAAVARRACCSRRTAMKNVQALIDAGLVEIIERGGRRSNGKGGVNVANLFRISAQALEALPVLGEPVDNPVDNLCGNANRLHPRGVADFTPRQGVSQTSPKPSLEPSEDLTISSEDPAVVHALVRRSLWAVEA